MSAVSLTLPEALRQAAEATHTGRLGDAERLCRAILNAMPAQFEALFLLSAVQFRRGRLTEALANCDRALALVPDHAGALNNRGVILHALGRDAEALASYDLALAITPGDPELLNNRANSLKRLGRFDEALAFYDRALALRPDYAEALCNRGNTLYGLRRRDEALVSYEDTLAIAPAYFDAHYHRATLLREMGRTEEAVAGYDRALALRPDHAPALDARGDALRTLKRYPEAVASYDAALAARPGFAQALNHRGLAFHQMGRFAEAIADYDAALAARPDDAEAMNNRGVALVGLLRFEEALASFDRAIAAQPDYVAALTNRGNALQDLGRLDTALASYDRALAIAPDHAAVHLARSLALQDLSRLDAAVASYDQALAIAPDHAAVHLARSLCLLLRGDFEAGWREYEWRWQTGDLAAAGGRFAQPAWLGGGDIGGRTLLLHAEQGFGDTLQFCRYAKLAAARGAKVVLEVQPELKALAASLDPAVTVIARGEAVPQFDLHAPLMSLPLAFATTPASIPAAVPYLSPPPERTRSWQERLGARTRPRVGLVWAGSPRHGLPNAHRVDRLRSIEFDELAPLFAADCEFVSLQKGDEAVAQLRRSPYGRHVVDWTDDLKDFADTAALMVNLDLVIAVDTAVVHLAGALGMPFWLLNRRNTCWRWQLNRDDSPWYPTARIFRQSRHGVWGPVVERIAGALQAWSARHPFGAARD